MSTTQQAGAANALKEALSDYADLKVKVPTTIKLKLKGLAAGSGQLLSVTTSEVLEKGLEVRPSDEQLLTQLFRRHLPHALFAELDSARAASRLAWTQVPQMLAARFLIKEEAPRPSLVPRAPAPPKVASPELVPVPWDAEQDSGIREAAV